MHPSSGVFLWGVLRHSLWASPWGQAGGRNTICISLIVVWLYSHSVTVEVYDGLRTSLLCVLYDNKMHTHSRTDTHPPGSSGCRRECVCVCVCECYLNKKERKWIRVVSILIVKQISTKHFEKVNDLRIITIYYSASQGGSWRSPDGYKNGI